MMKKYKIITFAKSHMPVRSIQQGYVALMSALIISIVLVILSVSVSIAGFYARFNVADSEYKQQSSALAEACLDVALLKLSKNVAYAPVSGGELVAVGQDACTIVSVSTAAGQTTIVTQAVYNHAVTNFKIVVVSSTQILVSWEELSTI